MNKNIKGWFKIDGVRADGDRTLSQQLSGVVPFLPEAEGKTVLDLGCAEGLIGREFAKAGAVDVLGIELLQSHIDVGRIACKDTPQVRFICRHLMNYIEDVGDSLHKFDIVLALSVIHKVHDPKPLLRFAARSAVSTLLFRPPIHAVKGVIRSKHTGKACDVPKILAEEGFFLDKVVKGEVANEPVECWRRVV